MKFDEYHMRYEIMDNMITNRCPYFFDQNRKAGRAVGNIQKWFNTWLQWFSGKNHRSLGTSKGRKDRHTDRRKDSIRDVRRRLNNKGKRVYPSLNDLSPSSKNSQNSLWLQEPPPKLYCSPCPSIVTQPEWMEYSHYRQDLIWCKKLIKKQDHNLPLAMENISPARRRKDPWITETIPSLVK